MTDRGNSGLLVQEIDDEKVTEMVEYWRNQGEMDWFQPSKKYPFLGWKICDGPAHVYNFEDGSIWIIVREGVGWYRDKPTKTPIQAKYGKSKDGWLAGSSADLQFELSPSEIRKLLKPELIPIESESVVRIFGARLESNLARNISAIKSKIKEIKNKLEEE